MYTCSVSSYNPLSSVHYHPHFTDEEIEAQKRLNNSPKVTHLTNSRSKIWTQVGLDSEFIFLSSTQFS